MGLTVFNFLIQIRAGIIYIFYKTIFAFKTKPMRKIVAPISGNIGFKKLKNPENKKIIFP